MENLPAAWPQRERIYLEVRGRMALQVLLLGEPPGVLVMLNDSAPLFSACEKMHFQRAWGHAL